MPKDTPKPLDFIIGAAVSALIILSYIFSFSLLEVVEYKLYDLRAKLRNTRFPNNDIIIVGIDDNSINTLGRWPWPRALLATLVETISKGSPKVLALNVILSEPDVNPALEVIKKLKFSYLQMISSLPKKFGGLQKQLETFIEKFDESEYELDNDRILSAVLANTKNLVLPSVFIPTPPVQQESTTSLPEILNISKIVSVDKTLDVPKGYTPILPIDTFGKYAVGVGHVNVHSDVDGVVRRETLIYKYGDSYCPSFALNITAKFMDIPMDKIKVSKDTLYLGNRSVPILPNGEMLLDFPLNEGYKYFSAFDVLSEKIPQSVFYNKIVIIGVNATGIADLHVTPVKKQATGTEIVTVAVNNLLYGKCIFSSRSRTVEIVMLAFLSLFTVFILPLLKARWSSILTLLIMLVVVFYGFYAFVSQGQWIKISYPAILLLSGYVLITTRRFLLTERKKELVEAESIETNKMLGLSFQGQGMLDLAFEKFRKCPVDESMKEILYNLALDYERKRQFNKAVNVYEHIATVDPKYRDIQDRMKILRRAGEAMQMPLKTGKEGTLIVEGLPQRPTLGRYEIIKELGRGAMGVVYLAKDPKINRTVAIKTIELGGDLEQAEREHIITRFYREAEAAGKLSHPNIIKVYDAGEEEDLAYLAIEYLEGEDLKKYCVKGNLLPLERAIEVVMKVADALAYAHSQGVVHRDIKPANIMLLKNGDVRVTDFGIARISGSTATQTGTVLGTPSYMSPEQIAGKRVDGRSDIFSLGVVLYELLTGKKPFESESITTLMYKITNEKHEDPRKYNPAIPESCVKIIDKALEKLPENRYQSASAMANDLKKCLETLLSYKKQQQTPPQKQKT